MLEQAIGNRYSTLAESTCCLSCGGAIHHAEPSLNEICFDLGSGRGTDVMRLAEKVGEGGFVYGQDISAGMLKKAREMAERLNVRNVRFLESPFEKIPLANNSVNLVLSNCAINHAADKKAVWSEVFRVLKNGGRFVVSDIHSSEPVPKEFASDPVAVSECWAGSVTRQEYMETLKACGFPDVRILEESAPYEKGQIMVSSFTIQGFKKIGSCCCH